METRKDKKRIYKQTFIQPGVFQIRNELNGKRFIVGAMNPEGIMRRHEMELQRGIHRNATLQQEWNQHGEENFRFEIVDQLDEKNDPRYNYTEDLKLLTELWLEKLQPYDDAGYNTRSTK